MLDSWIDSSIKKCQLLQGDFLRGDEAACKNFIPSLLHERRDEILIRFFKGEKLQPLERVTARMTDCKTME